MSAAAHEGKIIICKINFVREQTVRIFIKSCIKPEILTFTLRSFWITLNNFLEKVGILAEFFNISHIVPPTSRVALFIGPRSELGDHFLIRCPDFDFTDIWFYYLVSLPAIFTALRT
jgi:hypothetical protein